MSLPASSRTDTHPISRSLACLAALAFLAMQSVEASDLTATSDSSAVGARVLALVNEARASARRCGWKRLPAAPPLARSAVLDRAALEHARDMASRGRMEHAGSDGSTPGERATRAGYRWGTIGENVATGQTTPEQVVASWLESPRHCTNLMDPAYAEMGIGFAADPGNAAAIYWAQVLGTPLP